MATSNTNKAHRKPRRTVRSCAGIFFALLVLAAAMWGAMLGGFVWILEETQKTRAAFDEYRPRIGSKVYSSDGVLLGEFTRERRQLVPLSEMPLQLQKAFIATEDDTFYEHHGVRPLAIGVALKDWLMGKGLRGASTITQQTVRNIETTGISKEVTIRRKVREALMAFQLDRELTKDEILEIYLNQIFLGISAYGVEAASQQYFAKSCRDLSLGECAMLAGLTRAPNVNEPFRNAENAGARRDIVLNQMFHNGFISEAEYEAAKAESLDNSVVTRAERQAQTQEKENRWTPGRFRGAHFVEEVRRFIMKPPPGHDVRTTEEDVLERGLEVQTTLDWRLQQAAELILNKTLDEFDESRRTALEKKGRLDEFTPVSGALVCLDNRPGYEGYVRAMVGGRDFTRDQFNKATQARRLIGSSIKPFIWGAAIQEGMTACTIELDEPIQYIDALDRPWNPKNFSGTFQGPMTLRYALEKSVNIVSIKLVEHLGVTRVRQFLEKVGFEGFIDPGGGLTIALGTPTTSVLNVANCFATYAREGVHTDPVLITTIKDRDGNVLYNCQDSVEFRQAIPRDLAYVMTYLLQGVCTRVSNIHYPSGWRTEALGRPRAGKTGTTNDSRDVWFSGFTPDYTCVVWMGYDDNRPLGEGRTYTGGSRAAPIWTEFMTEAHKGLPIRDFKAPPGVDFYSVHRYYGADQEGFGGLGGGDFREAFLEGTRPPTTWPILEIDMETERLMEFQVLEDSWL